MYTIPRIRSALASGRLPRKIDAHATRVSALHTTRSVAAEKKEPDHTTDSYAKEVDATPAPDTSVHRVDPQSDRVQKPHEPPSGFSRSGVLHEEYRSTEKQGEPYAPEGGNKGNYGATASWAEQHSGETSSKDDGPEGKSSRGRK